MLDTHPAADPTEAGLEMASGRRAADKSTASPVPPRILEAIRALEGWGACPARMAPVLGFKDAARMRARLAPRGRRGTRTELKDALARADGLVAIDRSLVAAFGDRAGRDLWLWRRHRELEGRRPIYVLVSDGVEGLARVAALATDPLPPEPVERRWWTPIR